jgi:hypothetical protein
MTTKQMDIKVAHKKTLFSAKNRQLSAALPKGNPAICAGCVTSLGTALAIVKLKAKCRMQNAEKTLQATQIKAFAFGTICLE